MTRVPCPPGPPGDRRAGAGVPLVPQRILVIRLDRIGDVVLSTPVLTLLRQTYPHAFIAMMVRPVCRELIEGHPALNDVILYDKDDRHRSITSTVRFALGLRRARFDTALILHPSNRSHVIPWLAGIPTRIGYDRRNSWLLSRRLPHHKQEGTKHEAEYTVEMLQVFGIRSSARLMPQVPLQADAMQRLEAWLSGRGVDHTQRLVAIHPSASDRSKRWPSERFAQVADRLIDEQQARIILVAGPADQAHAQVVAKTMHHEPLNAAGKLSVGELACLLSRCRLLISNDSGPVHVAAAVGTPVVALFGRNQPGINATRWGPLGEGHIVLQKPDKTNFSYIEELEVEEVYRAALTVLGRR